MVKQWGILFSGQGAQKTGMGLDCYENSDVFRQVIDAASEELHDDLRKILANENHELDHTRNVQPALVAVSLGFYAMLQHDLPQIKIQASVGLSLGEYTALIASGKLPFKKGMQLLKTRASAMEEDSLSTAGKMIAVVDPQDIDQLKMQCEDLSHDGIVQIANYNSPHQIVIGGDADLVDCIATIITENDWAKKVVTLRVDGAFHTPLYQRTQFVLSKEIKSTDFKHNQAHVLSNTTGDYFDDDQIASTLIKQVVSPTHFEDCLRKMIANDHVNAVLEIGAGKTLSAFAHQIDSELTRERLTSYRSFCRFIEKAGKKEWI